MTAEADGMTATDPYDGRRCRVCGGPCWQWKGSVWEFTCSACLNAYLDAAAARADARDRKVRDRLLHKVLRSERDQSPVAEGQRRDGGMAMGLAVPTSAYADSDHHDDHRQRGRP